jgi:glutamate 5-kinase
MRRVVIKLGSRIVAHDSGELRREVLAHICRVGASLHEAGDELVLISSGAIARGMRTMGLSTRPSAIAELQAASAVGQGTLYRAYEELLQAGGATSAQVLLTVGDLSTRTQYLNARQTLHKLLEWRVIPVVNENDTTATDEISFGDNDFLAALVAMLISADLLILLTDTDGLFSADPRIDPGARLIEEVHDFDELAAFQIGCSGSALGSGGMRSKVAAAQIASTAGIPAVICSGLRDGALQAVLAGAREGTSFPPRRTRHSAFKLWLRYAKPVQGTLVIDAGAARALSQEGTSLLPVGIVEVLGDFYAGEAVEILTRATEEQGGDTHLGKGLCNYSSVELGRVRGLKSAAVREILPHATDEAVHRDQLVLE